MTSPVGLRPAGEVSTVVGADPVVRPHHGAQTDRGAPHDRVHRTAPGGRRTGRRGHHHQRLPAVLLRAERPRAGPLQPQRQLHGGAGRTDQRDARFQRPRDDAVRRLRQGPVRRSRDRVRRRQHRLPGAVLRGVLRDPAAGHGDHEGPVPRNALDRHRRGVDLLPARRAARHPRGAPPREQHRPDARRRVPAGERDPLLHRLPARLPVPRGAVGRVRGEQLQPDTAESVDMVHRAAACPGWCWGSRAPPRTRGSAAGR